MVIYNWSFSVGAAEWAQNSEEKEDNRDTIYLEVSIDGTKQVQRAIHTINTDWDQDLKMCVPLDEFRSAPVILLSHNNSTGRLSSTISIEIKGGPQNTSGSPGIARADSSFRNLLELSAEGDSE